jgi:GTP 3',8-cyclase
LEAIEKQTGDLIDSYGRVARKLRISVIDKCNFRCNFCMPENPSWLANDKILSFDEITRVVEILSRFGVDRVRISGGEPLLRDGIENLVARIRDLPAIKKIGITTNGYYLDSKAPLLKKAGLDSVTVSLHSLHPERFAGVTRRDAYAKVIEGIKAAKRAGFGSVKINTVVIRGYNDDELLSFAAMAHDGGFNVRFIEYMPFDGRKNWGLDKVVSGEEIRSKIQSQYELVPLERERGSTALNYRFVDSPGEIGIITSITRPFCSDCDRLRLTADGKVVPCLFDSHEYDLSSLLRNGASDLEIAAFLKRSVKLKAPGVETQMKNSVPLHHVRPMYRTGG